MKKKILLFMIVMVSCYTYALESSSKNEMYYHISVNGISNSVIQDAGQCTIIANQIAKNHLNNLFDFSFSYSSVHESNTLDNTATVLNKFTAKDTYNNKRSYVYKIKLKYEGGGGDNIDNWTCKSIIIEEEGKQILYLKERTSSNRQVIKGKPLTVKLNDGTMVTLYEKKELFARIKSSKRLTKQQCYEAINRLMIKSVSIVYIHLSSNTQRGKEYGQYSNGEVFLFKQL